MGRSPCCDESSSLKKGPWTPEEDQKLVRHIQVHGHGSWRALPKLAGLNRCGKSCRLRWTNYLRPDIKRGKFSQDEEQTILNLHSVLGNKWSAIASHLPGRTDNEIKNYWNTHLKKKLIQMGFDPMTHRPRTDLFSSLPQLLALANLMEPTLAHHQPAIPWAAAAAADQAAAAARLQSDAVQMARLQYLHYLLQLQPTTPPATTTAATSSTTTTTDGGGDAVATELFNSLKENPCFNDQNSPYLSLQSLLDNHSVPFEQLPELQHPGGGDDKQAAAAAAAALHFSAISGGELSSPNDSSPWLPEAPAALTAAELASSSSFNQTDACSANSSYASGGGASSFWPDLLLDDPLFNDLA